MGENYILLLIEMMFVLISLIISLIIFFKEGKNRFSNKRIVKYPPNGMNSIELSLIYRGYVERTDVSTLLIHLANKGYLGIIEKKEEFFFKSKIKIVKLREYDGNDENEKIIFNKLFFNSAVIDAEELVDNFYVTVSRITENIKKHKADLISKFPYHIFILFAVSLSLLLIRMDFPAYVPNMRYPLLYSLYRVLPYEQMNQINEFIYFVIILVCVIVLGLVVRFSYNKIFTILAFLGTNFYLITLVSGNASINLVALIVSILEIICINILFLIIGLVKKRTYTGNLLYNDIIKFRKFLNTADKETLECIIKEEPNFCELMLPYTFIFGNTIRWIRKFEKMGNFQIPKWYVCDVPLNVKHFKYHIYWDYKRISRHMIEFKSLVKVLENR